ATGGLTAFYMTRYFLLTFHGPRGSRSAGPGSGPAGRAGDEHGEAARPRESLVMLLPILILALPSAVAGYFARDAFLATVLPDFGTAADGAAAQGAGPQGHGAAWLPFAAAGLALLGAGLGWLFYGR